MVQKLEKMVEEHEREHREVIYGLLRELQEQLKEGEEFELGEHPHRSFEFIGSGYHRNYRGRIILTKEDIKTIFISPVGEEYPPKLYQLEDIHKDVIALGSRDYPASLPLHILRSRIRTSELTGKYVSRR